jgi:hypothetical protein
MSSGKGQRGHETFDFKSMCLQSARKIEDEESEWTTNGLSTFFHEDILESCRRRGLIEIKFLKKFGPNPIRDAIRLNGRSTVAEQLRELAIAS